MISSSSRPWRTARALACFFAAFLSASASASLTADQIALVVNSNAPEGVQLAEFYAKQRGIPDGRVIALDLPAGEELPYERFGRDAVPAVRKFLKDNALEEKVTCLVTFWGVPLRVARRPAPPEVVEEVKTLGEELKQLLTRARDQVAAAEALARQLDPAFAPQGGDDPQRLTLRADVALRKVIEALSAEKDEATRAKHAATLLAHMDALYGPAEAVQRTAIPAVARLLLPKPPPAAEQVRTAQAKMKALIDELNDLTPRMDGDVKLRERVRQLVRDNLGTFRYLILVGEQRARIDPSETEAAFDSELAMLWWRDETYPRHRWQANPLYHQAVAQRKAIESRPGMPADQLARVKAAAAAQRTLMVMRIDGPTERHARQIVETSLRVERDGGLKGKVALDARGLDAKGPYGVYDQTIRNLAALLKEKTKLTVTLDDKEPLFPAGSQKDVAAYCGWYSLRNYVPPAKQLNPGAVAFHVASSELVSLHRPNETGWVRGLLNDGAVASLGPVAEPYLHSFPPADEFFPLLFTGQLALAEVYWHTTPLVSWMNTCVGDPLYKPYAADPPLKVADLPRPLGVLFEQSPQPQPAAGGQ